MHTRQWSTFLLGVLLAATAFNVSAQSENTADNGLPDVIRVCADENGFPPFTYLRDHQAGQPEGFNVAVLNRILEPLGKRAEYYMMPWRRCLAMAQNGDTDLLMDVQDTAERRHFLMMPRAHYTTRPAMIARTESRHVMQMITNRERMLSLDICRILGWDISRIVADDELTFAGEPQNLASAVTMLRQDRCDVLIYTAELFAGGLHTGAIDPADFEGITYYLMPWQSGGIPKYFGVSRQAPAAQAIHDLLDRRISELESSGELSRLLANYLPQIDHHR